ncbi:hypothetical protein KGQ64_05060 [bacterium]|nr:hypothetical protein [bacterium]
MNRWVRVGLLTALIEYLKGPVEPPAPRLVRAPDPDSDPSELQRELAKLAAAMSETTRTLGRMIEFQDLTNRATGDGLSRLRDLVADAVEAREGENESDGAPAEERPARARHSRQSRGAAGAGSADGPDGSNDTERPAPRRRRRSTASSPEPGASAIGSEAPAAPRARPARPRPARRRTPRPGPGDGL